MEGVDFIFVLFRKLINKLNEEIDSMLFIVIYDLKLRVIIRFNYRFSILKYFNRLEWWWIVFNKIRFLREMLNFVFWFKIFIILD